MIRQLRPPRAIEVEPGADLKQVIESAPENATIVIYGHHRLPLMLDKQTGPFAIGSGGWVTPKRGQVIMGGQDAIWDGSQRIFNFRQDTIEGRVYFSAPFTTRGFQHPDDNPNMIRPGMSGARFPETLIIGGVRQRHVRVTNLNQLQAGQCFFDYSQRRVYWVDNPHGLAVELAMAAGALWGLVDGVQVYGMEFRNFASPIQRAVLEPRVSYADTVGSDWIVENCTFRMSHSGGARISNRGIVRRNRFEDIGHIAISGAAIADALIEENEGHRIGNIGTQWGWEAGFCKLALAQKIQLIRNRVFDTYGKGLWADIDCRDFIFDSNYGEGISAGFIFFEISGGALIIRNHGKDCGFGQPNPPSWTGGAAYAIATSHDVEVTENRAENCHGGIMVSQQNRASNRPDRLPRFLRNIYVHNNDIDVLHSGLTGVVSDIADQSIWSSLGVKFENNRYRVRSITDRRFAWRNGARTLAQVQGFSEDRQEVGSTVTAV